jgi:hypothetical protein
LFEDKSGELLGREFEKQEQLFEHPENKIRMKFLFNWIYEMYIYEWMSSSSLNSA